MKPSDSAWHTAGAQERNWPQMITLSPLTAKAAAGGRRCLQRPLVSGAAGVGEHVEAGQAAVTPVPRHTRSAATPARVVTASTQRTCNREAGRREEEKDIFSL